MKHIFNVARAAVAIVLCIVSAILVTAGCAALYAARFVDSGEEEN